MLTLLLGLYFNNTYPLSAKYSFEISSKVYINSTITTPYCDSRVISPESLSSEISLSGLPISPLSVDED